MAMQSVWAVRDNERVRLTVFRLNGKVGLALDEKSLWLTAADAYNVADQLMEQADEIRADDPRHGPRR